MRVIASLSPVAWAQRLGHLLELVGFGDRLSSLAEHVSDVARETVLLDPGSERDDAERDARWKLVPNVEVVSDL